MFRRAGLLLASPGLLRTAAVMQVRQMFTKELLGEWLKDKKELDMEVVKGIWPEKGKEVKVSQEEHERRVIIAKNWARYQRLEAARARREDVKISAATLRAAEELRKENSTLYAALEAQPEPITPTEVVPPYNTPPIPGFFHGKREI